MARSDAEATIGSVMRDFIAILGGGELDMTADPVVPNRNAPLQHACSLPKMSAIGDIVVSLKRWKLAGGVLFGWTGTHPPGGANRREDHAMKQNTDSSSFPPLPTQAGMIQSRIACGRTSGRPLRPCSKRSGSAFLVGFVTGAATSGPGATATGTASGNSPARLALGRSACRVLGSRTRPARSANGARRHCPATSG
jgi:hypothetical protein